VRPGVHVCLAVDVGSAVLEEIPIPSLSVDLDHAEARRRTLRAPSSSSFSNRTCTDRTPGLDTDFCEIITPLIGS